MYERPTSGDIYRSTAEQELHAQAVESLAAELNRDVGEVRSVYERVYLDLIGQARITDYLPLLVARRTRSVLLRG